MDRIRPLKRVIGIMLCTLLAISAAFQTFGEEETSGSGDMNILEAAGSSPLGDLENGMSITGYEAFVVGSSKKNLDTIKKGKNAKLVVYAASQDLKTEDVGKDGLTAFRMKDSFRGGAEGRVTVTSEAGSNLEFKIVFSKLTYSGHGSSLNIKVGYKKFPGKFQELETDISECEETESSGDGSDSADITGQPVIRVERGGFEKPVSPGEEFTLTLKLENTSRDSDVEDLVISTAPGNSMYLLEDTNSRIIKSLEIRQSTEIKLKLKAGTELTG